MKKIMLFITLVLFTFLVGCQKITKISLETMDATTYVEIDSDDLVEKLNAKADFMLYISSVTCTSCAEFKPILESIIQNKDVKVYKIEAGELFKPNNDYIPYQFTPTIVIISDGAELIKIDGVEDSKIFKDYDSFIKFYNKYIE